jgi:hypothetical protein
MSELLNQRVLDIEQKYRGMLFTEDVKAMMMSDILSIKKEVECHGDVLVLDEYLIREDDDIHVDFDGKYITLHHRFFIEAERDGHSDEGCKMITQDYRDNYCSLCLKRFERK